MVARDAMLAPFAEEEIRTFAGRGGKTMTFIEDETVMDRLDVGYGPGNWTINVEAVPYAEGVVKVRLGVRETDEWVWFEDFGYPNQAGGDVLKESVSDGIRRCGRYVGIARDLYRKRTYETSQRPVGVHAEPPTRPELERRADGLQGTVTVGKVPCDLEVRQTPDGNAWGFKLAQGRKGYQALAIGPLADALATATRTDGDFIGTTVTVWGRIEMVPWDKGGKTMPPFARIAIERVSTPDWVLPAEGVAAVPDPADLEGVPSSLAESYVKSVTDDDLSDMPDEWKTPA